MKKEKITENPNPIQESSMEDVFSDRFDRYAKEIITDRALPDVRDGLKPVQRRILFAMYKDGNVYSKPHRKSAKTVGLVIGNYHPHGDSSVYEAMVRLSQNWKMREPLVDMHGNNGSIDDDPAAAMRYTEARLSVISDLLLKDIDQNTVNFALNFDDTEEEPTVLPAAYPNLLVNGSSGIAIGYATNIPPHNLGEITEAVIYRLSHPDCSLDELMKIVKGPDFPTGGIVQGKDGIRAMFERGQGHFIIRGKTEIKETKTVNQIVITEIPYEVIKSEMVRQIDEIRLSKDAQGILDVRDESDRTGLRVVVDVRKEHDAGMILNYLFKKTPLQITYNANVTVIVNKQPKVLGLAALLDAYIAHRREVTIRRSQYQLSEIEKRCHILEGLIKAVSVMDEIIAIIRKSKDKGDAKRNLIERFAFTEEQAEAIVTLRLYRLSSTDVVELKEEYAKLSATMGVLKGILSHEELLRQLIVKELKEVKESCGTPRRTEIQDDVEEIVINKQNMILNERVMFTISRDGYVKRVSLRSYNASENTPTGVKEADELIGQTEVDLLDQILILTEAGNYLVLPVYEVTDAKWKEIGSHLSNFSNLAGNEKVLCAYVVKTFQSEAWIVSLSAQGMIKRTALASLEPQRTNRLYGMMNLKKGDYLMDATLLYRDEELLLATKGGYSARYLLKQIPVTSLKAQGVKAMNLSGGDTMAAIVSLEQKAQNLVVFNEDGGMKRLKLTDFSLSNRPVKGELLCKRVKSHPSVIRYLLATQTYDEILIKGETEQKLMSKDVALMSKEATFSSTISLTANWYLYKGLPEIRVVDITPEDPTDNDKSEAEDISSEDGNQEYEILSFNV